MIRFIFVAATVILFLILSIPLMLVEFLIGKKNRHLRDVQSLAVIQCVFRLILKMAGVKITVKGRENVPTDQAVLYVGNHRSYFDILVGDVYKRQILYGMIELGNTSDKAYKKSARIVGEVLGKYHPHGDSSVYLSLIHIFRCKGFQFLCGIYCIRN